jgi:DNA polymerase-3 subunit epsilon
MSRQRVVVDVETNGLDPDVHQAFEVAWFNLDTAEHGDFILVHNISELLGSADPEALRINRYIDRIPGQIQDGGALHRLHQELRGNTLVGSNPAFDAAFLVKAFKAKTSVTESRPWHHRLWDVSAYAAGVLGLEELPGLYAICAQLGVEPPTHTATDDVRATVECIRELEYIVRQRADQKVEAA